MPKSGEHRVNTIDSFFRVRPSSKNLRDGESVSFLEDGKLIKQEKRNGVVYETKYAEQGKTEKVSAGTTTTIIQGSSQSGDVTSVTAGNGLTGGGNSGPITLDVVGGTGITANANDIAIDSTVVTLTGTQTLTNKTLTAPTLTGTAQGVNLTLSGNLTVTGDTTTLNTATLQVEDKNIILNYLEAPGNANSTADGAGITIQDAVDASTDATMLWDATNDEFDFSHTVTAPSFIGNVTGSSSLNLLKSSNLSDLANASTARSNLGLGSLAELNTINGANWSGTDLAIANGGTGASTAEIARENLGLEIGIDIQPLDAGLLSIASLTTAANKMIYTTSSDTYAVTDLTSTARTLLDDTSTTAMRATLGLGTGAVLDTAGVSDGATTLATGNAIYDHVTTRISGKVDTSGSPVAQEYARFTDSNTIEGRSYAGVRTDLGLNIGTNVQAQDDLLQNIADFPTSTPGNDGKVVTYQDADGTLVLSNKLSPNGSTANGLLTYNTATIADVESNLLFNNYLTIKGSDPSNTYGIKERVRLQRSGNATDRQLQIYEQRHSGGRHFIQAFNTDITTDNSSAYTYTQGLYGGSSQIRFNSNGDTEFYNNASGTGGSQTTITPALSLTLQNDNDAVFGGDLYVPDVIYHTADTNTYIHFTNDRIRLYANGLKIDTDVDYVPSTRSITPVSLRGISGGGDLSADRTIELSASQLNSVALTTSDQLILFDQSDSDIPKRFNAQDIFDTISGAVTIYSNTGDNRILTSGGGTTINGESNLTFDGDFKVAGTLSTLETVNFDQASGDTAVIISGTGNQRLEFRDSATGANAWIGIPSWNDDAFYLFGPTSSSNELAYRYESSTHRFFTAGNEQLAIFSNGAIDMSGYSSADRHLEIGSNRQANGYAYIDLIGDTTYTDFGARFIRENTGPNTGTAIEHRGTGVLSLNAKDAGSVRFYTSNTERVRIDSSGNVSIGNISASRPLQIGFTTTNGEAIKLDGNASYGASIYYSRGGGYNWNAGVGGASSSASNIPASYWGVEDVSQGNAVRLAIAHTTGNVGIGTNSPGYKLDVVGTSRTDALIIDGGGTYAAGSIYSDSNWGMLFRAKQASPSQAEFRWANSADSELMRIDSSGNLKLPSDNQKLIIGANSDLELYAHNPAGDSRINVNNNPLLITYNGVDRFRMNSTSLIINEGGGDYNFKVEGDTDASLFFVDAGTDRVGIGTTSPAGKLMVREDTAGSPTRIIVSNNGTAQSGTTSRLSFYEGTSEKSYIERRRDDTGQTAFVTPADDNPFVWENATGEFMRFTNSNVGIGTNSPLEKLQVAATATNSIKNALHLSNNLTDTTNAVGNGVAVTMGKDDGSYSAKIATVYEGNNPSYLQPALAFYTMHNTYLAGSETEKMRITSAGNVGIGTTSPADLLHIADTASSNALVTMRVQNSLGYSEFGTQSNYARILSNGTLLYAGTSSQHFHYIGGSTAMTLNGTGLGIGTSPSQKLHVAGSVRADTAYYVDGNIVINTDGNFEVHDTRAVTPSTDLGLKGVRFDFKNNSADGLSDGGTYHGVMTFQQWNDTSGGHIHALGFTDNGYVHHRNASIGGTFGNWKKLIQENESGNVGIGTVSPQRKLHVSTGNTDIAARFENTSSNGSVAEFISSGDSRTLTIQTDHIYSNGSLFFGLGNYTNTYRGADHRFQIGTGNTEEFRMDSSGNFHADGDVVAYSTTTASDIKFKENVKSIPYGLKEVLQMNPVEFDWIEKRDGQHDIGFIAQEMEKIVPEVIKETETLEVGGTHKTMDYAKLTSILVQAIQEQQEQINKLKEKLNG